MNKIDKIYENSKTLNINYNSKIVIMSDCHRGSGDNYDNFIKNQNIFESALIHYYQKGFTYIELGDGDDMWEVENYKDIIEEHLDTFKILKKFHENNRLLMIYGNHDICKKYPKVLKETFYEYYDKETEKKEELLKNLVVLESLILKYNEHEIFLIHGHQAGFLNSTLWPVARFLVRHVWRPLENIGIQDPTSAAKNYKGTKKTEKKLEKWSKENNKILIAGHTHRPIFPKLGESLYFNDGSCVHPNGITCIEIENGNITLVKWAFDLKEDNSISVGREIIAGKESINNFFRQLKNEDQ